MTPDEPTSDHRSRRAEIVETAAELFAQHGYGGVAMDEIGASLNISGPALYWHFTSKEQLLDEVLSTVPETLLATAVRTVADGGDAAGILARLVDRHLEFALARPAFVSVRLRELGQLSAIAGRRVERNLKLYAEVWVTTLAAQFHSVAMTEVRAVVRAVLLVLDTTATIVEWTDDGPDARSVEVLRQTVLTVLLRSWRPAVDPMAAPAGTRRGRRSTTRAPA